MCHSVLTIYCVWTVRISIVSRPFNKLFIPNSKITTSRLICRADFATLRGERVYMKYTYLCCRPRPCYVHMPMSSTRCAQPFEAAITAHSCYSAVGLLTSAFIEHDEINSGLYRLAQKPFDCL